MYKFESVYLELIGWFIMTHTHNTDGHWGYTEMSNKNNLNDIRGNT